MALPDLSRIILPLVLLGLSPCLLACEGSGKGGSNGATDTDDATTAATTDDPTMGQATTGDTTGDTTIGDTTTGDTTTGDTTTGATDAPEPPGEALESDKERELEPDISAEELAAMAADERAFGAALFHGLGPEAANKAVSPTSLRHAFGMTYAGARTISRAEIEEALEFNAPGKVHAGLDRIDLDLASRNLPASGQVAGDDSVTLTLINEVFGRTDINSWEQPFLDVLAEYYGSSMHLLDFGGDPDGSRLAINAWVAAVTLDKIGELIPAKGLAENTTTVLVNALYLKAPWQLPFESVDEQGSFTRIDGTSVTAGMMTVAHPDTRYLMGTGFTAAEIPLRGGKLTMVVILPDTGTFAQFFDQLDGAMLGGIFAKLENTALDLTLPRFKFSTDLALKTPLQGLGLVSSFQLGSADFSGMSPVGAGWAIADVFHDTFIGVDEKGVEAAAASAVVIEDSDGGSPVDPEAAFIADRPFVFAIRDRGTDSLLFLGQVFDPSL